MVDTGSKVNIISKKQYIKIGNYKNIQPSNTKLIAYAGHRILLLGKIMTSCIYKQKKFNIELFITEEEDAEAILGRDTCTNLKLIQRINTIHIENQNQEYNQLLSKYADIFEGVGKVPYTYNIKLNSSAQPVIHGPCP